MNGRLNGNTAKWVSAVAAVLALFVGVISMHYKQTGRVERNSEMINDMNLRFERVEEKIDNIHNILMRHSARIGPTIP